MKKVFIVAAFLLIAAAPAVFAEQAEGILEWSITADVNLAPSVLDEDPLFYDTISTAAFYNYDFFSLIGAISIKNDKKYTPAEDFWFGHYFSVDQGGVLLDFEKVSFQLGRFYQSDVVDTPYSLFFSSMNLPALVGDFTFSSGVFTYKSHWMLLNYRSANDYMDRGMNYKLFSLQFGDFRVGLQDVVMYTDYVFDAEYFLSPIPHTIVQMQWDKGKPWSRDTNDNILMGLFADLRKPDYYLYAQTLLDDINLDFLVPEFLRDELGVRKIPQKAAWSLGGYYQFSFGRLGFYHAGATKYIFAPNTDYEEFPYQYCYYPDVRYTLADAASTEVPLDYRDNYIGYLYGENNLAFLLDYSNRFASVDFGASLEYVISGSKSPANPWHEATGAADSGSKTRLLDDTVLEHTIAAEINVSRTWNRLTVFSKMRLGGVFNELELLPPVPPDGGPDIFQPVEGNDRLLYQITVGVSYLFGGSNEVKSDNSKSDS